MSAFNYPFRRALDASGNPLPGAKLNFYATGTSVRRATYSDIALTSANANPVVADADGRFPPIWLLDYPYSYKVVLTDADDVTIEEDDPVWGVQSEYTALSFRLGQVAANPLDYGAVGTGYADESTAVQAAIDRASGQGGRTCDLLGGTYRCDTGLTLPAGVTLRNGTLDFSNASGTAITIVGSIGGLVSCTTTTDDNTPALGSWAGISQGDWLALIDGSAGFGELVRVEDPSATRIYDYTFSAISGTAQRLAPASGVRLIDLEITGPNGIIVSAQYATDLRIERCKFAATTTAPALRLLTCAMVSVDRCEFVSPATGDAVEVRDGSASVSITGCRFDAQVSASDFGVAIGVANVATSIQTKHVTVRDCRAHGCGVVVIGYYAVECTVDGCVAEEATNGIEVRNPSAKILNCHTYGIDVDYGPGSKRPDRPTLEICGNKVRSGGIDIVCSDPGYMATALRVCGNSVHGAGISIDVAGSASYYKQVVSGNVVQSVAAVTAGIYVKQGRSFLVEGNTVHLSSTGYGIYTDAVPHPQVVGNHIFNASDAGIFIEDASAFLVGSNDVESGGVGIILDNSDDGLVSGNRVTSAHEVIKCANAPSKIAVQGNHLYTASAAVPAVEGTGSVDALYAGNWIQGGTYGIQAGSADQMHDGNVFDGQATGATNGTFATAGDSLTT